MKLLGKKYLETKHKVGAPNYEEKVQFFLFALIPLQDTMSELFHIQSMSP